MYTGKDIESPTSGQGRDQSGPGESQGALEESSLWTSPGGGTSSRRTRHPSSITNTDTLRKSQRPSCLAYQKDFHQHETREAPKRSRLPGPRQQRPTQHETNKAWTAERKKPDTPEKDTPHTSIGETHSTSTGKSNRLLLSGGIWIHGPDKI